MSLFSSLMRDFNSDPFFSPMESMRQMEALMDSMMSPFDMGFPRLTAAPSRRTSNALMPFGFGRSLFPNVDDMFANFERMAQDPNVHCYTSSSVMSYTTDEHGRPQLYQASSSTRTAPGGVKETRQTVQDTRSGLQSMAIGHHLGERAHIIERKKNRYTGEEDENQEFINLEEEEAVSFNQEWQQRAQQFASPHPRHQSLKYNSSRWRDRSPANYEESPEMLAITAGPGPSIEEVEDESGEERQSEKPRSSEPKHKRKAGSSSHSHHRSGKSKHEKTKHMKPSFETTPNMDSQTQSKSKKKKKQH